MEIRKGDNQMADAYQHKEYVESDAVKQAQALLQQQQAAKPGAYQSQWQTSLNETLDKILNREKFNYDLNGDALYQQYKDQYVMQGQKAMMDTMGQAQAMTGGYGNSYAQTAGQQTYQGYLQQLNDKVPELYQLALSKYQMEGDALMNQYGLMADQEDKDYGRYRDSVSDWQSEVDRLQSQYNAERDYDYSKYTNDRDFSYGQYVDDRNYQYQVDRDAVADQQWQTSYDYQVERDKIADEQWQKEFDEAIRQYNESLAFQQSQAAAKSSSGGGSSGGSGGGYGYDTHGMSTAEIKALQAELGVAVDGIWGPKTEAAYQAKYGGGGGDNTSFTQKLANVKTAGATEKEREQLIDEMVADGTIAPSQAAGLKHIWAKG